MLVTVCFFLAGASQTTLLVMFNVAVMSAAATFSPDKKRLPAVFLGSLVILLSIVLGGVLGFYVPFVAQCLTVIYAACAFFIPRTRAWLNILVSGAVVFLIFSFLPFDLHTAINYLLLGVLVVVSFTVFYWLFDQQFYRQTPCQANARFSAALLIALALILAYALTYVLQAKTTLQHIYWVPFTTLVIAQGVQLSTITIAIKRIIVNTLGALLIVILFTYVIPGNFWPNFFMLIIFLFCIFFFGFSYMGRTLFIELFVLGYTHLLGQYHNFIAYDRIIMTFFGGLIVIIVDFGFLSFKKIQRRV